MFNFPLCLLVGLFVDFWIFCILLFYFRLFEGLWFITFVVLNEDHIIFLQIKALKSIPRIV